jgi:hypothetical protein
MVWTFNLWGFDVLTVIINNTPFHESKNLNFIDI